MKRNGIITILIVLLVPFLFGCTKLEELQSEWDNRITSEETETQVQVSEKTSEKEKKKTKKKKSKKTKDKAKKNTKKKTKKKAKYEYVRLGLSFNGTGLGLFPDEEEIENNDIAVYLDGVQICYMYAREKYEFYGEFKEGYHVLEVVMGNGTYKGMKFYIKYKTDDEREIFEDGTNLAFKYLYDFSSGEADMEQIDYDDFEDGGNYYYGDSCTEVELEKWDRTAE